MPTTRTIPAPAGFIGCTRCSTVKPETEFWFQRGKRMSWCKDCKRAWRRESTNREDPTAIERFWPKVEKTEGCWNWIGGKDDRGYGFFYFRGNTWRAHRVSLALAGVEVPEGTKTSPLVIDHMCRNLACVRPDHLRVVTRLDNVQKYADRSKSGDKMRAYHAAKRASNRSTP